MTFMEWFWTIGSIAAFGSLAFTAALFAMTLAATAGKDEQDDHERELVAMHDAITERDTEIIAQGREIMRLEGHLGRRRP